MSKGGKQRAVAALSLALCLTAPRARATPAFTSENLTLRQDFNTLLPNQNGQTPLPDGWVTGTTLSSYGAGSSSSSRAGGITGAGTLTASSLGGAYNFADGESATAPDRAMGFLTTSTYVAPRNLFVRLANDTGQTLTGLNLSYDFEKYRTGKTAFDFKLYIGTDGTTWSFPIPEGSHSFAPDATTAVVASVISINKSLTLDGLNVPSGGSVYLRWLYTTGVIASTQAQGLAIDNFVATALLAEAPASPNDLIWDGDGAAGPNPSDAPGTWSDGGLTWQQKSTGKTVALTPGQNSTFGAGTGTINASVVTLVGARSVGKLTFAGNSAPFTLTGGSVTLNDSGGAGLRAEQSATIASDVHFIGQQQVNVVHSSDILLLSGGVTGAGITVAGSGTLGLTGRVHLSGLALTTGARVDIGGSAIIDYGTGEANPFTALLAEVKASYDHGKWTNAGSLICSAAADGSGATTLAIVDNAGTNPLGEVDGDAADGTSVLLKYTYLGDADLSGSVNHADLQRLLAGLAGGLDGWQNGDFNLDHQVNADDLTLYSMGAAAQAAPLGPAVPEPAVAGALAVILACRRLPKTPLPRQRR